MRLKLSTESPLPKYQCWFGVNDKLEKKTIHDLRKKIVKDLELAIEPTSAQLLLDGFGLLPQTTIQDLLRDGDLITIQGQDFTQPITKKRKASSTEEEHGEFTTRQAKKSKKSNTLKKIHQDRKPITAEKKSTKKRAAKKETRLETDKAQVKKLAQKEKETKQTNKQKDQQKTKTTVTTLNKRALPFEGTIKTHNRNMRRRLLKQRKRQHDAFEYDTDISLHVDTSPPPIEQQIQIENLRISKVPVEAQEPVQLLKQNKNKRKNHLNQLNSRQHIYYQSELEQADSNTTVNAIVDAEMKQNNLGFISAAELADMETEVMNKMSAVDFTKKKGKPVVAATVAVATTADDATKKLATVTATSMPNDPKNIYGRAFITLAESEPNYKGRNNRNGQQPRPLPIDDMPTLFYAQAPHLQHSTKITALVTESEIPDVVVEREDATETEEPAALLNDTTATSINYESLPVADFKENVPSIGSHLAIKTLELTANYTPEISDWKHVILKEITSDSVVFEYTYGFGKASTKGGKFDIKKHKRRFYDEYGQEYYNEEDEEEIEEEENWAVFEKSDIFALRVLT